MEGRRVEVHPEDVIHDIEKIIKDTFPKNITIEASACTGLWALQGDATQLHQVLLNLCVNSRDAMPEGGRLTLTAENVTLDAQFVAMNLEARPGNYVLVQVEDTGTGIPETIIDNIFDPFFTTKEIGKGTGLGLSTSQAIIKGHEGFIRVISEPGKGTRFLVYLPAQTAATATNPAAPPVVDDELPRGNGETVLVIDDEEPIRRITKQTLESFGYRVIVAGDGAQGVSLYGKHQGEIAVVLTDMMMPVMDGDSTIKWLLDTNPDIVAIAASGITSGEYVTKAMKLGVKMFLPKPFTAASLAKALKNVLSAQQDSLMLAAS